MTRRDDMRHGAEGEPHDPAGPGRASPRREARRAALQVLYFAEIGRTAPDVALGAYFAEHAAEASDAVREFTARLVRGTAGETSAIDALIARHSQHWRVDRLATIDRLVLRMAVWELRHEPETPSAVVLNEALELARTFSTDESVAFVNGVLDAIRRTLEGLGPGASGRAEPE